MSRPITSELIARAGASLSEGGWRYTPHQLYYATCAAAETPPRSPARSQFALGALLVLVSLILLPIRPAALATGSLAALSLLFGLVSLLTRRPATGRFLPISYPEFEAMLRSDPTPEGLAADIETVSTLDDAVTVVCDTDANASAVLANSQHAGASPMRVLIGDDADLVGETVVALHDASPRGCALPLQLVDAGARVVDAGLRPAWVGRDDVQILEGAPARLPRDLSTLLTESETDWLRSGRRVELATLRPDQLMRLVESAVATVRSQPQMEHVTAGVAATVKNPGAG